MKNKKTLSLIAVFSALSLFWGAAGAMAQTVTVPSVTALGAGNVEILSNTTIPGVTGIALQSRAGAQAAYTAAGGLTCTNNLSGDLGGQVITSSNSLTVVCLTAPSTLNGVLTINAPADGTVVIRTNGNLTFGSGAQVALGNGNPNSVFYAVNGAVTIGPNAVVQGTILATGNITVDPTATLNGRALSLNGVVNADPADINCPSCIATSTFGRVTVNKTVINDNGGTAVATDFQFFVGGIRVNPATQYAFVPGTYAVSELLVQGNYLASPWGGDCSATGNVAVTAGASLTCTVTNNDLAAGTTPTTTPPIVNPPTSTPGVPNTGSGGNIALIVAILGGAMTGIYFMSRGIKTLNR